MPDLRPERALVFRITHIENVPWLLENGLWCRNGQAVDPHFVSIGNPEIIHKRQQRVVPVAPAGTLGDYVPFYFTPHSPMLYNILTGYNGIRQRSKSEIVILVSSLHHILNHGLRFVFTDRHAYMVTAEFFSDLGMLDRLDWSILQARDFRRDVNDLGKIERYQAEALIYKHAPVSALLAIACYDLPTEGRLQSMIAQASIDMKVIVRPEWYF